MKKIKIVTDSTSDLSRDEMNELNIQVIPLTFSVHNRQFVDGVDFTPQEFMDLLNEASELPKSSQPAIGEFVNLYNELGADGSEILSIHLASKLSGTFESAQSAAEMSTSKVTVIDSKFISKALAFQVREAAKLANLGYNLDQIIERLDKIRNNTRLLVLLDTLENLVKGGRIGKGKAMLGSLLNIKPVASLINGEYSPIGKVRNTRKAVDLMIKQFMNDIEGKKINNISISHANSLELALSIKSRITELTKFKPIEIDFTSPVISTHTGPGAIGLMYSYE